MPAPCGWIGCRRGLGDPRTLQETALQARDAQALTTMLGANGAGLWEMFRRGRWIDAVLLDVVPL